MISNSHRLPAAPVIIGYRGSGLVQLGWDMIDRPFKPSGSEGRALVLDYLVAYRPNYLICSCESVTVLFSFDKS